MTLMAKLSGYRQLLLTVMIIICDEDQNEKNNFFPSSGSLLSGRQYIAMVSRRNMNNCKIHWSLTRSSWYVISAIEFLRYLYSCDKGKIFCLIYAAVKGVVWLHDLYTTSFRHQRPLRGELAGADFLRDKKLQWKKNRPLQLQREGSP